MVELIFVENKSVKMVSTDYLSRTVETPQGSIWIQYKWIYLWIFKSYKLSKTILEFCIAGLIEFVGQICPQSSVPFFLLGRLERSWQSPMQPLSDMQSGFATEEWSRHDPTSKLSYSCSRVSWWRAHSLSLCPQSLLQDSFLIPTVTPLQRRYRP